jgi:hypothetical protein
MDIVESIHTLYGGCTKVCGYVDNNSLVCLQKFDQTGFSFINHIFHTSQDQVLTVCAISNPDIGATIQVIDLATDNVCFSQKISNNGHFIPIHLSKNADSGSYLTIDSIFILEAIEKDGTCIITPKKLFKTLPLYQFQYLMDNKQYEEAESLAMRYNMDIQVLLKNS